MWNNSPTEYDIFVEISEFRGVVKMKILIIGFMNFFDYLNEFSIPKNIYLGKNLTKIGQL